VEEDTVDEGEERQGVFELKFESPTVNAETSLPQDVDIIIDGRTSTCH